MDNFIGRIKELALLQKKVSSKKAELIAVTGRRRVGKTFLIRQLEHKNQYFEAIGEKDGSMADQLDNFFQKLLPHLKGRVPIRPPQSWKDAFALLTLLINSKKKKKPVVIFLDELPWMATPRSGLIQALEYYWNSEWSKINNLTLIVCGSASSWVNEKLINAKGGLYNRVTHSIHLPTLQINEVAEYFRANKIKFKPAQIIEAYMAIGGVPFYLDAFMKSKSLAQNLSAICFERDGLLFQEYERLFQSLFGLDSQYEAIVRIIASKRYGLTRNELLKKLGATSSGYMTKYLNDLEASGFIQVYTPFQKKKKDALILVIDEYTLFYHSWIKKFKSKKLNIQNKNYWQGVIKTPAWYSWAGFSFESFCLKHIDKILKSLEIEMLVEDISFNWAVRSQGHADGSQVDLIISRKDNVINLCEIKFSQDPFLIDKTYATKLMNKVESFVTSTKTKKEIHLTFITNGGLKENVWSEELVDAQVDVRDFLK